MSSPAPRAARLDAAGAERPRLLIITGLSGAGKSYAIKCFEDLGYYCVDNLPTTLIPTFAELAAHSTRRLDRIALGVDIREREYLHSVVEVLAQLRAAGYRTEVLFLEASEETLVRRYQETRRRHPVSGTLLDGIRSERTLLANLRELADAAAISESRALVTRLPLSTWRPPANGPARPNAMTGAPRSRTTSPTSANVIRLHTGW